jgi:hypothetical protein
MQFEESPSLDKYKDGLPEPPPDPAVKRKRFRIVLLIVLLLVLFLGTVNFLQSQMAGLLLETGAVSGMVLDEDGNPFQVEVFILGTELAVVIDANGYFVMDRVPAGQQSLIVADEEYGNEFPITVIAGGTIDVGQIQFVSTATP